MASGEQTPAPDARGRHGTTAVLRSAAMRMRCAAVALVTAAALLVEAAKDRGIVISFAEFSRAGVPITLLTLGFAFGWVVLVVAPTVGGGP